MADKQKEKDYKTPDLSKLYKRQLDDMPVTWNFRVLRIRRGQKHRLNLGPYVDSLDWGDDGKYGSGSITFLKPDPDKPFRPLDIGDMVRVDVWYKGRWTQIVTMRVDTFPDSSTGDGALSCTMKDDLSLLTKAKRDWRFRKTRARKRGWYPGEIAKAVAKREGLRVGKIHKGLHRIDKLEKKDTFGLDVIFAAYEHERKKTGKRYAMRIVGNRLEIQPWARQTNVFVVNESIESASITRGTEKKNPATAITGKGRIGKGDDAKKVRFRFFRPKAIRRYGLREKEIDYGRVSSEADLRKQVKADYADEIKAHKTGSITVTGMPFIRGQFGTLRKGEGIKISIPAEGMTRKNSWFWTTSVRHTLSGGSYTVSIDFDDGDPWLAYEEEQDKSARAEEEERRRRRA